MKLYRNGTEIADVKPLDSTYAKYAVMAENSFQMDFYNSSAIDIKRGDYCTAFGRQYFVSEVPIPELIKGCYKYSVKFLSAREELEKCILRQFGSSEVVYTCTPLEFLTLVVSCMQAFQPTRGWSVGDCIEGSVMTLSFTSQTCLQALQSAAGEDWWNTEFYTEGFVVNFKKQELIPSTIREFSVGEGLKSITPEKNTSADFYTRLYALGGTKNLPSGYAGKRLKMDVDYLEDPDASVIIEHEQTFDEIFPHRTGTVSEVSVVDGAYYFKDADLPFNPNDLQLDGLTKHCNFKSGALIGLDFEVNYNATTGLFQIITYTDDSGYAWPSSDALPAVGDTYVLYNISQPQSYIDAAMVELKAKAQAALDAHKKEPISLNLVTDDGSFFKNETELNLGEVVKISDPNIRALVGGREIRITEFKRYLNSDYKYDSLKVSDIVYSNPVSEIKETAEQTKKFIKRAGISDPYYPSRNWSDMVELSNMISTLRASMLLIGEIQGAFSLPGISFTTNYQSNKNMFNASAGNLVHKTIPSEDNPKTWTLAALTATMASESTAYYLYAKCSRSNNTATFVFSASEIAYDSDAAYYYFFIGVLSSVLSGARVFATVYGYTQITGDTIRTGKIISPDGATYFDIANGIIGGKIKFLAGTEGLENITEWADAKTALENDATTKASSAKDEAQLYADAIKTNLQNQIDGNIISWFRQVDPLLTNSPASDWTTEVLRNQHANDTYTNTSTGGCWRFQYNGSTLAWEWAIIADTATQKALVAAAAAQTTADGKRTTFSVQPTTAQAYQVGDLWANATYGTTYSNDLLKCKTAKASGTAFDIAHWEKASKYTDDTAVTNLKIGGRNLFLFNAWSNGLYAAGATISDIQNYSFKMVSSSSDSYTQTYQGTTPIGFVVKPSTKYILNFKKANRTTGVCYVFFCTSQGAAYTTAASTSGTSLTFTTPSDCNYVRIRFGIANAGYTEIFSEISLVEGDKTVGWTLSPEDVQAEFDSINSVIADMSSDNILSPIEKSALRKEWNLISGEKSGIDTQAASLSITTEKDNYDNYFQTLATYLNAGTTWGSGVPSWIADANIGTNTVIVGSDLRSKFYNFEYYRQILLNKISSAIQAAAATDASNKVNNLKIGGRNLWMLSKLQGAASANFSDFSFAGALWASSILPASWVSTYLQPSTTYKMQWTGTILTLGTGTSIYDGHIGFMLYNGSNTVEMGRATGTLTNVVGDKFSVQYSFTTPASLTGYYVIGYTCRYNDGTLFTMKFTKCKLEIGDKYTDSEPATEDVQYIARITAQDNLAQSLGYSNYADLYAKAVAGSTIIKGGYINTNLIDVETLVASAAFIAQLQAISIITSKLTIKTADSGARIEFNNDGSNAIALINSDGVAQMGISPKPVVSAANIGSGANLSTTYPAHSNSISNNGTASVGASETLTLDTSKYYDITTPNVTYNIGTTGYQDPNTQQISFGHSIVKVQLIDVTKGTVVWENEADIYSSGAYQSQSGTIAAHTVKMRAGSVYRVDVTMELLIYGTGPGVASAAIASGQTLAGVPYLLLSEIGLDGINYALNSGEYFHYGTSDGLVHKGLQDLPGILATGTIDYTCVKSNEWGAKKSSANATKGGTGLFNVPHNAGSVYSAFAVSRNSSLTAKVISQGNNTFQVGLYNNSNVLTDPTSGFAFNYVIFGAN